jgi:hypothetical protein
MRKTITRTTHDTLARENAEGAKQQRGAPKRISRKGLHVADQVLLPPVELAEKLKVKIGWIYRRTHQGAVNPLPVVHGGKALRFHLEGGGRMAES